MHRSCEYMLKTHCNLGNGCSKLLGSTCLRCGKRTTKQDKHAVHEVSWSILRSPLCGALFSLNELWHGLFQQYHSRLAEARFPSYLIVMVGRRQGVKITVIIGNMLAHKLALTMLHPIPVDLIQKLLL